MDGCGIFYQASVEGNLAPFLGIVNNDATVLAFTLLGGRRFLVLLHTYVGVEFPSDVVTVCLTV